ncbi:MAG: hypothetical protein ERJ68_00010 [Aphanocapsa feldmannii 277cI]|uniref:Putative exodeoxyribonuclease 8 PDDEXK-like domain-containing protein n=1 Tax=Aphanocapsa feldmannii 277cI TaxID=2507554 RepID=A0A524RVX3_9CHRO|nr:MAG: hypothetical protein ERJ68_00010 [Aphanocapsa feldmannii 277cI]
MTMSVEAMAAALVAKRQLHSPSFVNYVPSWELLQRIEKELLPPPKEDGKTLTELMRTGNKEPQDVLNQLQNAALLYCDNIYSFAKKIRDGQEPTIPWCPSGARSWAWPELPRELYDLLQGWNSTLLKRAVEKSPLHAYSDHIDPNAARKDSPALLVGRLLHSMLLEPEVVQQQYYVLPADAPLRPTEKQLEEPTRTGTKLHAAWLDAQRRQKWWQAFEAEHAEGEQVSEADYALAESLAVAVQQHPILGAVFPMEKRFSHLNELTLSWVDPEHHVRCKCRLDAVRFDGRSVVVYDFKSAIDADREAFGRVALDRLYWLQAAYYTDAIWHCLIGLAPLLDRAAEDLRQQVVAGDVTIAFEFVAIEKTYPFPVARYALTNEQLQLGRQLYMRGLDLVVQADRGGVWAGYPPGVQLLPEPPWAARKVNALLEATVMQEVA